MTTYKKLQKIRSRRYAKAAVRRIPAAIAREEEAIRTEIATQEAQQYRRELIQEMRELAKLVAARSDDKAKYEFSTHKPYGNGKKWWEIKHEAICLGCCHYEDYRYYFISKNGRVYARTFEETTRPWVGCYEYERVGFNCSVTNRQLLSIVWKLRKTVKALSD